MYPEDACAREHCTGDNEADPATNRLTRASEGQHQDADGDGRQSGEDAPHER
jgi:hypothetical protein